MNKTVLYSISATLWLSPMTLGLIPVLTQETAPQDLIKPSEEVVEEEVEPPSTPEPEPELDLNNKDDLIKFAEKKVKERFGETEWEPFYNLINKESGWNPNAQNPYSTAFGLGQFIRQSQINYGIEGVTDPERQLEATMKYVEDRYGSPWEAWQFHVRNNYY